jgi:hypothetical protein
MDGMRPPGKLAGFAVLATLALCGAPARAGELDYVLPSGDRVPGARLSDLDAFGPQAERVRRAVAAAFAVEIGRVPVHIVSIEDLRTLHREVGGRLPSGWQLDGFELDGHVFVRRGLGGVPDEVLIHECLHALSRRFSDEAHARGVGRFVEGLTQYLTLRALAARPPSPQLKAERNRTYVGSTDFAQALAGLIGQDELAAGYFHRGFAAMAARVDAATRGKHRLLSACNLLDQGDELAALKLLSR